MEDFCKYVIDNNVKHILDNSYNYDNNIKASRIGKILEVGDNFISVKFITKFKHLSSYATYENTNNLSVLIDNVFNEEKLIDNNLSHEELINYHLDELNKLQKE